MEIRYIESKAADLSSTSCYKYWMGNDFIQSTTGLFFMLVPILAVIPYGWSYFSEKKSGYIKNITTRVSREKYFISKYIATFLSGGLVVVIPLVLNFIICACVMAAYTPDVNEVIYFGIYEESLWSEVFYNSPLLYRLLYIMLNFVFSGLWATMVFAVSFFVKNRFALMIGPYLLLIFVKFLSENVLMDILYYEVSPFNFLRGTGVDKFTNGYIVFGVLLILFAFSSVIILKRYRNDIL